MIKSTFLGFLFVLNLKSKNLLSIQPDGVYPQFGLIEKESVYSMELKKINTVMSDTLRTLQVLGNNLQTFCKPIADKLEKGLNSDYIEDLLNKLNIRNDDIKELYRWHNGIKDDIGYYGQFVFSSHGKMMPLEAAVNQYEVGTASGLWSKDLFPLFTNNGGDFLLVDVNKESKTFGRLLLFSPSVLLSSIPEPIYDSVDNFCETIIACFEHGAYEFNSLDNTLDVDYQKESEIAIEKNPYCANFWNGKEE